MKFRSLAIAAFAVSSILDFAHAADETPSSLDVETHVPSVEADMAAYRDYAKAQANSLAGMTKVLAREIKDGNLDAARMAYAPAHRYLERIKPIATHLKALDRRLDAYADDYDKKESDPRFTGFHRIEYGLYENKSTGGLSDDADRLDKDARELRERIGLLAVAPADLLEGAIQSLEESAHESLMGEEERYSKTDLWDLEARVDGARQVVEMIRPGLQA